MAASVSPFQCVATLGPASFALISRLAAAGATSFRLNTSHMSLQQVDAAIRSARDETDCPLILDLQGAKMRVGVFTDRLVDATETVTFVLAGENGVPLPHPEIYEQTRPGDTLSLDDDRLRFTVLSASSRRIEAKALSGGTLRPRKGINVVEHPVVLSDLPEYDRDLCDMASGIPRLSFAISFVSNGEELDWARRRAPGHRVIAKIERREASVQFESIARRADEVWICRGDLGAQLGVAAMACWIAECSPGVLPCPVLMAGQVLEHLTEHATPTRSEVCHLQDLVARGYAGIVLSDETAIGSHPEVAVRTAVDLINAFRSSSLTSNPTTL